MLVLFPMQEQSDDSSEDEAAGDTDSTWTYRHGIYNVLYFPLHSYFTAYIQWSDWFSVEYISAVSLTIVPTQQYKCTFS